MFLDCVKLKLIVQAIILKKSRLLWCVKKRRSISNDQLDLLHFSDVWKFLDEPFLRHQPIYPSWPLPHFLNFFITPFFIPPSFKTFYTVPFTSTPQQSIHQPHPTSTSPKPPSHWRYLFPATNHNHLNSNEKNRKLIQFFFVFFYFIRLATHFVKNCGGKKNYAQTYYTILTVN